MTREEYEKSKVQSNYRLSRNDYDDLKKNKNTNNDEKVHLALQDGKEFGTISSNAYRAISNGLLDYYNPVDDNEKKVLDSYREHMSALTPKNEPTEIETKKEEQSQKDGFGSWLGKQAMAGLGQFNKGLTSTLDFILPTEFLGKYDFISKLNDYYSGLSDNQNIEAQKSSASRGKGWKTAGDVVSGTVAALPNAVLAYMSAGTSIGATGATTLASATPTTGTTVSALKQVVKTTMKNPSYWTSAMRTLGTDYEEAKERGANDFVAATSAILTTALNAGIEVGGGIEQLPKNLKQGGKTAIYDWVKSTVEEGGEEVLQKITTNAVAKLMYDHDAPIYSTTDENAVINPISLAKDFGMGVAVGGLLGGGQATVATGVNTAQYIKTGKYFKGADAVQAIIDTGLESSKDSTAYKLAEKAQKKGGKLSDYEVGKLYYANVEQIEQEEQVARETAKTTKEVAPTEKTSATDVENTTVEKPVATDTHDPVSTPATTEEVSQRNTFTEELDEISGTEMPTVSEGDTFIESSTNKIIKVTGRNESVTNIELTTPDGKKETKLLTNKKADTLAVDDKYTKVETPDEVVVENATTTTNDNNTVTTPTEKTEISATVDRNADDIGEIYNIYGSDAELITEKLGLKSTPVIVDGKTVSYIGLSPDAFNVVSQELNKIGITLKAEETATTTEAENASVTDESISGDKVVENTDVDLAEGEILSLKHTKNIYSLFKGAKRVAVGEDCITDGAFAIPLTDKTLEEVKKVYKGEIETKENLHLSKLYNKDNDVIIQGNPKVDNTERNGKSYVFDIAGNLYIAQQKYIDAFNKDGNVIKANSKDYKIPWTVHDKNGNFIAIIMPMRVRENPDVYYSGMPTVKDVLDANKQKKAENAKAKEIAPEVETTTTEDTKTEPEVEVKAVSEETLEERRNKVREKAAKTGKINLDELGTLTGIPVTHMSDSKGESTTETKAAEEVLQNQPESDTIKEKTTEEVSEKEPDKTVSKGEASKQIADYVADKLAKGEKISAMELSQIASKAFGGTMADNAFTIKDAYDAMELGVNQHILSMKEVSADKMLELLELLPTQTKRTEEMVKFQQFSTPPSIAYLANYTANVNANDIMLEPSAGIGGIAVFAKKDGAKVYVNELDGRRLEVLKNMPFDGFFNEDAEQIDNILGGELEPTVVVMNPPFSSSAERNMHKTKIGAKHIEQALKILAPNGRLVAIVGKSMADGEPAFRTWWNDIKSQYNVRANIGINGKNYNKYGTNFDIQMLVIDKTGATTDTVTGYVDTLQELQEKLGGIRDERPAIDYSANEQRTPATTRTEVDATGKSTDVGNRTVSNTGSVTDKGKSADKRGTSGKSDIQDVQPTDAEHREPTSTTTENTDVVADEDGRVGSGQSNGLDGKENSVGVDNGDSGQSNIQTRRTEPRKRVKRKELTDSIFEQYQTQPLTVKNAQPHPAKVSESAAMSAIEPPVITYKPNLPQDIVDKGVVSAVQLEAISYAGQSHSQTLPNGTTRGFFLGDGTGIGKGRTIAGMMLDNYNQGRKKAVWVTLNSSLVNDAKRDVKALFGDSDLVTQFVGGNKADSILNTDEAIMVISYSALSKGFDKKDSNFEKIVNWLGKDFDGLIVFDEAHKMGNATSTKGTRGMKKASQTGIAGISLQEALPKAKIVYSSATGATEVENLRYAERLGLWGEGTPFIKGDDFVSKVKAGGLAAMELIARDMKAMGVYLSRNISYDDVQYDKITHKLTAQQTKIYDELASSWQIVLQNINKALETTNQDKDGHARGRALGAFWSSQQRFFNQILTSMQVPSVISDIEKQLADEKSCVIQLVSTNEAAQNQEFERLKSEDLELDEFDLTPKQVLMSLIENAFPVQQFEEYRDDNGNVRSRPVFDSKGNPVINREAVRQREELLTKLGSIKVPSSPIDMIINHFGTDLVAENTGRARRVIQKDGKTIEEKIGSKKDADVDAFQNGNKRIIIFSKAGGTGKSYHADKSAKNQQQRVHYLLEAGWQADNAVQGFGRSHRSNQASAPIFKLVTTDLKGQMRFISTIAKRLDQLGAMTKGQRQAGSQGMFSASDNLETSFAADVLAGFYKDLIANKVDGIDDGLAILEKLGLKNKILDEYNRIIPTASELREVNKFLNRILSLESTEQNTVFEGYSQRLQDATEKAMLAGTLDKGLENYKADKITLNEVQDIREDERSGAKTKYYNLTAEHKIKPVKFEDIPTELKSFVGLYQNKNTGAVRAVYQTSSSTDQYGNVVSNYKLMGQVKNEYIPQHRFYGNWTELETADAEKLWNEEVSKLPEFRKENLHLISGVVLPVWDKLPTENVRIYRVLTSDGEMLIGRVVSEDMIDETLRRLGSSRKKEKIATKDLVERIKSGDKVYLDNDWMLVSRKVSGEDRIELMGVTYDHHDMITKKGVFAERISYRTRYFVPTNTNTEQIIDDILKISPVMRVENAKYSFSVESEGNNDEQSGSNLLSGNSDRGSDASAGKQAKRVSDFKQKIKGKTKAERRSFAKELLEKGQTEEVTNGNHQFNIVKLEAYNDDMLSIVEEAKANGKDIGFFIGHGKRKFSDIKIDAVEIGNKVYVRYDGFFSPQTLLKHEEVHDEWNNPEMQKAKDIIRNDLSEAEKKKIFAEDRYKAYMEWYKDEEKVWQEFIADVFAGMNDYTADYIDTVVDYWYDGKVIDRYNPAEYINSIDSGGNQTVLDNIGLGDEYKLSESGEAYGHEQGRNSEKLGQLQNSSEVKGYNRVGEVGQIQQEKPNTPNTKNIHRSGVSAETITSSGLTAEQATIKTQNKMDGLATEFYVKAKENGAEQKDIFNTDNTVYYPDSVFERDDLIVENGVASFSEKRFNDLISDYSVPVGGQLNRDYAKAYVAYISPSEFLSLTTVNEQRIVEDTKTNEKYGNGKLDIDRLSNNQQTPFLEIDFDDGVVTSHEGRHRMVMLRDAGIEKVAIVIRDINPESGKYQTKKMTDVFVTGQEFTIGTASGKVTIGEIIPLSPNYRDEVREKFVDRDSDVKYSFSVDDDIAELTPERKKEIFEQFEKDRVGVDKPTQKQLWGERAEWIAHNVTRVFPEIPERGEKGTFFAEFRKMMIQWKALPQTSMFMTQDKLNQMTKDLTPAEFKTFSELVYFLDLQEEAQIQKDRGFEEVLLPNEITPMEVDQIVDVLNKEATDNVKKALEKRRQIWDNLKEQYITLNQYIGFDTDGKFNRKNYYHHQVIEYMNQGGKGVAKGKDIEIKAGRGWLKERQGSTKATNTDFLAVEYKAMLQMQYDIYVANMLGKIKDQYDIKPQLEKQAFNHNKDLLKQMIADEATDENGNVMLDSKGKPDSETYRQQQWYNQRIMFGFSGLFDLAEAGMLPTFNGQYGNVIRALQNHNLNAPGLYNYVGEIASMELPETATDEENQAQISARTVLKYTSQKKAWVKETLADDYQTWETLANDMKDTHSIHQPRRGNYFYTKTTVDEDAFNKAFSDMIIGLVAGENGVDTTADMKKLFDQYSETVRLMGAAYEQWVIPNEIEVTMNKVANPKQANVFSKASRSVLSAWKGWSTSVNPLRTVKFGIRNLFGDLDAVIAGNPKVVLYSKQAVNEIRQAMKHKKYSPEFMEWVERGGYSSLIFANEMDTEMQDKIFSHLKDKDGLNIFKIPSKLFEGYYNGVETAHNFREAILRYSAYLYFKNDIIKNDGKVKDNVASNRYIIRGLQSVEDKAYQLSKDLLGAYDEVATMGQALRRHAIPFYSFTETNLKRYYRLFENIIMSDDSIPKKAGKVLLKCLMVNLLTLLMVAWNKLVMKDEDEELPPSVRNIPHITLGKIGDDVYAFRQLGSFSEILEWVGLEDYKWTEEDLIAPVDKAVGMITPVAKTPVELLTGLNFYPSITQPRAIRDKWEHLFSSLGVDDIYKVATGKPTKGIGDIAKGAVTYTYDYKESAYYEILDVKREYQGDTDNTIYGQTPKSNALYYMKTAIRYKDKDAALKYLDDYFENGGTAKGVTQSIAMLNPLYGYTSKDSIEKGQAFVNSLSDDEKDKLRIAINYYENDLMLPENVSAMLRKKGITDEQAKNLLTNYINSKCK